MKSSYIAMIAVFWLCSSVAEADKLQIEFDAETLKAFGAETPIVVEAIRTKQEIEVRVANVSAKHLVITKGPDSGSSFYRAADGSKLEEGAWVALATPPDFFDHIVLRPKPERDEKQTFSSWSVFKIASDDPKAKSYVFECTCSGYFPTIDKYLTFTIKGELDLSPEAKVDE